MAFQVNSEFYTGWLDHWGDQHAVVDAQKVSRVLGEMLTMGANVNMYVSPNSQFFQGFLLSGQIWLKDTAAVVLYFCCCQQILRKDQNQHSKLY